MGGRGQINLIRGIWQNTQQVGWTKGLTMAELETSSSIGKKGGEEDKKVVYVYRISTAEEWEALESTGTTFGRQIDKSTGCIHLSDLHQVQWVLHNFFRDFKGPALYLLQIDAKKLGDGLVYEAADDSSDVFPHFYGPSRSFAPLPLHVVTKAEKLILSDAKSKFTCSLLA